MMMMMMIKLKTVNVVGQQGEKAGGISWERRLLFKEQEDSGP